MKIDDNISKKLLLICALVLSFALGFYLNSENFYELSWTVFKNAANTCL